MTELRFSVTDQERVAVTVYDRELKVVHHTLSSETVDVEPGFYSISARLADGGLVNTSVEVADQAESVAVLPVPRGEQTTQASLPNAITTSLPEAISAEELRLAEPGLYRIESAIGRLTGRHRRAWIDPHPPRTRTFVTEPGWDYFRPVRRAVPDGPPRDTVELRHPEANLLLDYLQLGLFDDARIVAGSVERQAEELLRQKVGDPVAAAAGAYALLYLGELDLLHNWTMNLADWFPWLPDGTVIAAEHLAREGDHGQARRLLRKLDQVDGARVPWLSAGLFYACDRLRTYCEVWPEDEELRELARTLNRVASRARLDEKVTTAEIRVSPRPRPRLRRQRFEGGETYEKGEP
jgi:hypothetical protein